MKYLFQYDAKVRSPLVQSRDVVHVDENSKYIDLDELAKVYQFTKYYIGGTFGADLTPEVSALVCRNVGIDIDDAVGRILRADVDQPDSIVRAALRTSALNKAQQILDPRNKIDKLVMQCNAQVDRVRRDSPHRNFP